MLGHHGPQTSSNSLALCFVLLRIALLSHAYTPFTPAFPNKQNQSIQDGVTAFEALESGVLHPLRDLLVWVEGAAAGAAAHSPRLAAGAKVAAELERDAVGALALVPSSSSAGVEAKGGEGSREEAAGSVAVVEVGSVQGRSREYFFRFVCLVGYLTLYGT